MIKKIIIKTNEWYEGLPNIKGDLFYLSLCFIPYILILFLISFDDVSDPNGIYPTLIGFMWLLSVAMWRVSYKYIKELENIKK